MWIHPWQSLTLCTVPWSAGASVGAGRRALACPARKPSGARTAPTSLTKLSPIRSRQWPCPWHSSQRPLPQRPGPAQLVSFLPRPCPRRSKSARPACADPVSAPCPSRPRQPPAASGAPSARTCPATPSQFQSPACAGSRKRRSVFQRTSRRASRPPSGAQPAPTSRLTSSISGRGLSPDGSTLQEVASPRALQHRDLPGCCAPSGSANNED